LFVELWRTAFSSPLRGGDRPLEHRTARAPHAGRFVFRKGSGTPLPYNLPNHPKGESWPKQSNVS